jgi:hypothetical protein
MVGGAADHFGSCVRQYALDLLRETSRLEEAARAKSIARPEITTTMVINADDAVRHALDSRESLPIPILLAQSLAFTTAIIASVSGAYLHSWLQWILTGLFGLIAASSQVYALFAVRRK